MSKYSPEEKMQIAEMYLSGKYSYGSLARIYGVQLSTIRLWVANYESLGAKAFEPGAWTRRSSTEKEEAVLFYLAGKGSLLSTCKKYGIKSTWTLRNWIKKYNSHETLKPTRGGGKRNMTNGRKTTLEERIALVEEYVATKASYDDLAAKYKVSYQQAYSWVRKYKDGGVEALEDRRGKKKDISEMTEMEKLEAENRLLRAENERKQMEIDFLKKLKEIERRWG